LVERQIIVQKQADILHQIRDLGNQSVHELVEPQRKTIRLGLEIIEGALHNIYELDKYNIGVKKLKIMIPTKEEPL
jgi:hypothetical protein